MQARVTADELAKDVPSAENLVKRHKENRTEIDVKEKEISRFIRKGKALVEQQNFMSHEVRPEFFTHGKLLSVDSNCTNTITLHLQCNTITLHLQCNTTTLHLQYSTTTLHLQCNTITLHLQYSTTTLHLQCNSITLHLQCNTATLHLQCS